MANARRYAGLLATVSALALIIRLPMAGSLAQDGTRPQRTVRSCRTGSRSPAASAAALRRAVPAGAALGAAPSPAPARPGGRRVMTA